MSATIETRRISSNSCPSSFVQNQSYSPSMPNKSKLVKSINFDDAKDEEGFPLCPNSFVQKQSEKRTLKSMNVKDAKKQRGRTFPRTLEVLFKKAAKSKNPPSWTILRGKERRKHIKHIMQALGNEKNINPFSVEQFQSFKNALKEHGQEEAEIPKNVELLDNEEKVVFDFGCDYGNSEFDRLDRQLKYDDFEKYFFQRNRVFDDLDYGRNGNCIDLMELSSVEEILDGFLAEKLF